MSILKSEAAVLWRQQFKEPDDFVAAGQLLKKFKFVTATEFKRDLRRLILSTFPVPQKAAFYIERELQKVKPRWPYKKPDGRKIRNRLKDQIAAPMYKEVASNRGPRLPQRWTAAGSAIPAVRSPNNLRQEVGSEGVVASLVSRLCRTEQARFIMHPHTTALKRMHVKQLVVVTDFIGSGKRTWEMLDSLWRVASVRSWKSSGYCQLSVLCYSATDRGLKLVRRHPCHPTVVQVRPCPTISNSFKGVEAITMENLCSRFPPGASEPLGYKRTGALIAFEHSCPNNVPAMFTTTTRSKKETWTALFPSRSAEEFSESEISDFNDTQISALDNIRCSNIARNPAFITSSKEQRAMITLLAAIYKGRRNSDDLVAATCLPFVILLDASARAQQQGLLTSSGRLTTTGFTLIVHLNRPVLGTLHIPITGKTNYYPSSLREPY
ncbi:phosphoribosyltransferase-like protein [Noviherbaspirillum sp. Root189]|uniref:phosphoribosyltransferase-like protein n=1 Tax=Noviherbaspirillum sp. Root189 TaxID=1736487 RepID=UPI0012E346F7|nr:hypothetical protein [Noviherbaspirillum sp. Root189]